MKYVVIAIVLLLGACSQTPQTQIIKVEIPQEMLVCEDYPKVIAPTKQSDVALFITDLDKAYWSCKDKLSAVKEVVK